ncbi:MAG TPA: HAD family hydrolase [Pricia antarctica]|uniref:phosphoglycolate phosphatase n=2 Tax=root TaxID=1 RepID=A0A831QNH2_9FLAO|nr:HAD family hydrolase [Pricia antarctica]
MIKTIIWDFDGVILDSMAVRDIGFKRIFSAFDQESVAKLLEYHRENGGLSRYVKIRYFFTELLSEKITENEVREYAHQFSKIMINELTKPSYLIQESLRFIKNKYKEYNFHVASGSDQEELRYLCKELDISKYFISINGSPTPKEKLVEEILDEYKYERKYTCLIGDSINDRDAAKSNGILFLAYNNEKLNEFSEIKPLF